jgi:predicted TIM-barrel fold metal-dependent hydrolase
MKLQEGDLRMNDIQALDGDGHVEEWEATWSDEYLEPKYRDRRPKVIETGEFEHDYIWEIDGERIRVGGSPSSRDGVVSTEYELMAKWRGPHESGEFHSAEDRLAVMDAESTYLSVNYPTLLLHWPIVKDPDLNAGLTRSYNNWVADVSNQSPERLKWVTVIDPRDPSEAVREMERTKKMGSLGIMVFGDYGNKALDHPDFEPIWAAAQDLELPVNVHPGMGAKDALRDWKNIAGDQFLTSVVRGFKTICGSGILDRYPKVKVSFLETGCTWVDFAVAVMDFTLDNVKDRMELGTIRSEHQPIIDRGLPQATPLEYIKDGRIFIGFEVDDQLLPYMVGKYGTDCWVYASDIPHAHRIPDSPNFLMNRTDLTQEQKDRIIWKGTTELYGLKAPQAVGS